MDPKFVVQPTRKPWYKRLRRVHWILIAAGLIIVLGAGAFYIGLRSKSNPASTTTTDSSTASTTASPTLVASPINGVMVSQDTADKAPIAAMIENSEPARPQTGLTSADVVYEAVTEGGITRFMGIFSQTLPDKAGPIRSARSYFIDYLSEYDAMYVHEGGSPTALSRIKSYNIKDTDNFTIGYHREPKAGLASEHTLYANIGQIWQAGVSSKSWPATLISTFKPWTFKDPSPTPGVNSKLTINFSSSPYQVVWTFDQTKNLYSRVLAGTPHKDAVTGEQITAQTVVVMNVHNSPNGSYSDTGHEAEWTMNTIGSGKASIFEDGTQTDGTWQKPSRTERTRFYDAAGKEIPLDRGKIWVEVVPQSGSYSSAPSA